MIRNLRMGIGQPSLSTRAEIERQRNEPLTQVNAPEPSPEPQPPLRQQQALAPQGSRRSLFDQYALYGLAGHAVRTLAPHTEAQPEAILLQLLAAFGNVLGAGPHCMVGATRHTLNFFVVLVGESSKARKGTSRNQVAHLFRRDPAASELWNDYYASLSQAQPGLHTAATGRAEAQVLRISALYAALDCSPIVQLPHLQAALALWDYCAGSAASLFGACVGDSIADRIHEALQAASDGLSRKQIRGLFHGNVSSGPIDQALERLSSLWLVMSRFVPGRGRATTLGSAIDPGYGDLMEEETAEPEESPLKATLEAILETT
jgi:hypothetical protein